MAEQKVELAPGESKQVSFEAVPNEAKAFQVSIDGLSGSFRAIAVIPQYSGLSAEVYTLEQYLPNIFWVFISGNIYNPKSQEMTVNVTSKSSVSYKSNYYIQVPPLPPGKYDWGVTTFTIPAGQSVDFRLLFGNMSTQGPMFIQAGGYIQSTWLFWLEDDLGGKSEVRQYITGSPG